MMNELDFEMELYHKDFLLINNKKCTTLSSFKNLAIPGPI